MKFKYDWRSIDCSKMPDYNHLGAAGALGFGTEFYDNFWSTSDCELIPKHCYIKFIKGFDVSQRLINCTEEVANGTR